MKINGNNYIYISFNNLIVECLNYYFNKCIVEKEFTFEFENSEESSYKDIRHALQGQLNAQKRVYLLTELPNIEYVYYYKIGTICLKINE